MALQVLDYLVVMPEHQESAQATFVKKGIFYSMRNKALSQHAEAAKRSAKHAVNRVLEAWYTDLKPATQQRISLEYSQQTDDQGVVAKLAALQAAEDAVHAQAAALQVRLQALLKTAQMCSSALQCVTLCLSLA